MGLIGKLHTLELSTTVLFQAGRLTLDDESG